MQDRDVKLRLNEVLAAYGAAPERWPEDEREQLLAVAGDAEFVAATREARALDRVLDGSGAGGMSEGLAGRILAAAAATPQDAGDNVVAMVPQAAGPAPRRRGLGHLPEVALLAASLLAGVWIGGTGLVDTTLGEVTLALQTRTQPVSEDELNLYEALQGVDVTEGGGVL